MRLDVWRKNMLNLALVDYRKSDETKVLCEVELRKEIIEFINNNLKEVEELEVFDDNWDGLVYFKKGELIGIETQHDHDYKGMAEDWGIKVVENKNDKYDCINCRDGGCWHCESSRYIK